MSSSSSRAPSRTAHLSRRLWSVRLTYAGFSLMAAIASAMSLAALVQPLLPAELPAVQRLFSGCFALALWAPLGVFFAWLSRRLWRTGRYLVELREHRYCVRTNWWLLVIFPLGTLVGGCALWVLYRPAIVRLFTETEPGLATPLEPA